MLVWSVVLVSDEQQSDSIIYVCVCVYSFSGFFHDRLLQDIEHSSLCCTVDPCCLFYGQ